MTGLADFLECHNIKYDRGVDLKCKTWIKTGGTASFWITPQTSEELISICQYLYAQNVYFEIVGHTSNLFFRGGVNGYNPDVVVSTIKLTGVVSKQGEHAKKLLQCDCGVKISTLSRKLANDGYSGYYGLVDLPGTVAAAVYNNAGCFKCSVSKMLDSITLLTPNGEILTIQPHELGFAHRTSTLKRGELQGVIISVTLKLEPSSEDEIKKIEYVRARRARKQEGPAMNLGSVYCRLKRRVNIKNSIIIIAEILLRLNKKSIKLLFLYLYGYSELEHYISDKSIGTFIWRDSKAEEMFEVYNEFINRVHKVVLFEIEIKDGRQKKESRYCNIP